MPTFRRSLGKTALRVGRDWLAAAGIVCLALCAARVDAQAPQTIEAGTAKPAAQVDWLDHNREHPTVREVLQGLKAWQDSWATLRLTLEIRPLKMEGKGITEAMLRNVHTESWIFTDRGDRWLHQQFKTDGRNDGRVLQIIRPDRRIVLIYPDDGGEFENPVQVSIQPNSDPGIQRCIALPAIAGHCNWLPGNADFMGFRIDPPDKEGDREYPKLSFSDRRDSNPPLTEPTLVKEYFNTVAFDPDHSYLPRFARVGTAPFETRVTEFRQVPPGIWLPWKGTEEWRIGKEYCLNEWEIKKAEFNVPVIEADLTPPVSKGTIVMDGFRQTGYVHGGGPARRTRPETPSVEPRTEIQGGSPVQAEAPRGWFRRAANPLTYLGLALVVAGLIWWKVRT